MQHCVIIFAILGMFRGLAAEDLQLVCTTFPMQQLTLLVVDGRPGVTVTCLLPPSQGCPHDYALTPQERATFTAARVIIANGLGLEEFLGDLTNDHQSIVLNTSQAIPPTELLCASGLECHHDRKIAVADHHAVNPHLFSSPRQAARMVRWLGNALGKIDPAGAAHYQQQAVIAATRLEALASEVSVVVSTLSIKDVVTQHDAFDYYARDVGLNIIATVQEHPGHDPSAVELHDIIKQMRLQPVLAIFTEPQYAQHMALTVSRETGVTVATLDPVASGPENAPLGYYEKVQRVNLATLAALAAKASSPVKAGP